MSSVDKRFRRIYIDTNVFVGCFRQRKVDVNALEYLFKLKNYELYTSTLAISQTISILQGKSKDHVFCSNIKTFVERVMHKVKVIGFSASDIEKALSLTTIDMEDNIQFVLGEKMSCYTYVTNNIKDFRYNNIEVVEPAHIRNISIL